MDDERILAALLKLWDLAAEQLLGIMELPTERRATLIGALWDEESTRRYADLLIDLESDPHLASAVVRALSHAPPGWAVRATEP